MPGGGGKGGGSATSTVNVNNGPISVDSDSTVEIAGLDRIGVTAHVDPLDVRQSLRIPEPIVTRATSESKSDATSRSEIDARAEVSSDSRNALSVDLKPVVLDVCSTTSTKLPHGEIAQPFNYHFGLTWFGVELFGFTFGGESRTVFSDLPKRPAVEWPAQQNAAPHAAGTAAHLASSAEPRAASSAPRASGLRIRIK